MLIVLAVALLLGLNQYLELLGRLREAQTQNKGLVARVHKVGTLFREFLDTDTSQFYTENGRRSEAVRKSYERYKDIMQLIIEQTNF
jgi:hypothetical protein